MDCLANINKGGRSIFRKFRLGPDDVQQKPQRLLARESNLRDYGRISGKLYQTQSTELTFTTVVPDDLQRQSDLLQGIVFFCEAYATSYENLVQKR